MKQILISALLVVGAADMSLAATASWTANKEADLAGYNLYLAPGACATPGAFAKVATYAKMATSGAVPIAADGTYCGKMTAFDTGGLESTTFSNTAEVTVNVNPPVAPAAFGMAP